MRIHVLNSATMPKAGRYDIMQITPEEFFRAITLNAHRLVSSIGYPANIELIRKHSGVTLPLSRAVTDIQPGDMMLIMRLKYRADGKINSNPGIEDFEFFSGQYTLS